MAEMRVLMAHMDNPINVKLKPMKRMEAIKLYAKPFRKFLLQISSKWSSNRNCADAEVQDFPQG